MSEAHQTRREFLAAATGAVTGAALSSNLQAGEKPATTQPSKALNYNPRMGYRPLGNTGIQISEIGLGGHGTPGFGEKVTPEAVENRRRVLARAAELGINYLDTNMCCECDLYGQALKGQRERWLIGFASWPERLTSDWEKNLSEASLAREIDARLKAYGTDWLDVWRPVGATWGPGQTKQESMLEISPRVLDMVAAAFEKARRAGKVRVLGVSVHNQRVFTKVLEHPQFSVIYCPYLFLTSEAKGEGLTELAAKKGVGVIAIKPFAAGATFGFTANKFNGAVDAKAAVMLKKVLQNKAISAVLPGVNQPEQLKANVRASYERYAALTPDEQRWLAHYADNLRRHLPPEYHWLHEWLA